ncbi:winged helix-turn-helix domain-containing protein [Cellulomonas carbonis]|uniref:winged helix-turn-helix domain-containing protein n=1 Tax=Cellulomonas carbonis TaxID=1386092 RepID=UPI001269C104|nr:winged helix-turn-helix domain-containing protein [Cellulomonas carbonis]
MTAVPVTVTDAPASAVPRQRPDERPGLVVHVAAAPGSGEAGREALVELAARIDRLVADAGPLVTARPLLAVSPSSRVRGAVARLGAEISSVHASMTALERAGAVWGQTPAVVDDESAPAVVVDTVARDVTVDGESVALTFKEFALLEYLLRRPNRAVDRAELLHEVWHKNVTAGTTRTIDVHVRRLREKLGGCLRIVTVRGVGYRWDLTPDIVLVGSGDAD